MKRFWFGNQAQTAGVHSGNILSSSSILALDVSTRAKTETKSVGIGRVGNWSLNHLCPLPLPSTHQGSKGTALIMSSQLLFLLTHLFPSKLHPSYFCSIPPIRDVALWGLCWGESGGNGGSVGAAVTSVADNLNWLPRGFAQGEAGEGTNCRGMMKRIRAHAGPHWNPRSTASGLQDQVFSVGVVVFKLLLLMSLSKSEMCRKSASTCLVVICPFVSLHIWQN